MTSYIVLDVVLACSGLYILKKALFSAPSKQNAPLPPGPKRKFLIGNLLDLPKPGEQEWVHWNKHKDLYGKSIALHAVRLLSLTPGQAPSALLQCSARTSSSSTT